MVTIRHIFVVIISLLLPLQSLSAQLSSKYLGPGRPFIKNFPSQEYDASDQNWAVAQHPNGLIYVANNLGILEFDGQRWRLIRTRGRFGTTVRSLAIDSSGVIYAGAQGELGYLAADRMGQWYFLNLAEKLPPEEMAFRDVWQTHALSHGIYFRSSSGIFRWHNRKLTIIKPKTSFHLTFAVNDTLYVRQREVGLMRLQNDSLIFVPGSERFANISIYGLIALPAGGKLLCSNREGLFRLQNGIAVPFVTPLDNYLRSRRIYDAKLLDANLVALGTRLGGLVLLDLQSNLFQIINKNNGLQNNFVHALTEDNQGGLWLALDRGISRIEFFSPFRYFPVDKSFDVQILFLLRHANTIYAGSNNGVFSLPLDHRKKSNGLSTTPTFQKLPGIDRTVAKMTTYKDKVLAISSGGIYHISPESARRIPGANIGAFCIFPMKTNPALVLVGHPSGLSALFYQNGNFEILPRLAGITETINEIAEERAGSIWLGTNFQGAIRLDSLYLEESPKGRRLVAGIIEKYDAKNGLAPDGYTTVNNIAGEIRFGSNRGLLRFDNHSKRFIPDSTFGEIFADSSKWTFNLFELASGDVWVRSRAAGQSTICRLIPNNYAAYDIQTTPFQRLTPFKPFFHIFPENQQKTWFGGANGIFRYDNTAKDFSSRKLMAMIRGVSANYDSLIFGGAMPLASPEVPQLPFRANALRFSVAAPDFDAPERTEFRYLLEGFDNNWSPWTSEMERNYTNLPEGQYRFRLLARNLYGQTSPETQFKFMILPPWYRSWWAFFIYLLLFAGAMYLFAAILIRRQQRLAGERLEKERGKAALREAEWRARHLVTQKELEKQQIRRNIARDLHDDVSATLSSIAIFAESIRRHKPEERQKRREELLSLITESADEAREAISDIIWMINPENDYWQRYLPRLQRYIHDVLEQKNIDSEIKLPQTEPEQSLDFSIQKNLMLIIKELTNNIARHSGCRKAIFELKLNAGTIHLTVSDDGRGFDTKQNSEGNGLRNIRERIAALKGQHDLQSAPGKGTHWDIRIPLP